MTPSDISPIAAFIAGIISFLSPCVLPLVPPYLSYITGLEVEALQSKSINRGHILRQSLLFVLGFTLVFVALGATASSLGSVLAYYTPHLTLIAGIFIFIMGIHMMGIFELSVLKKTKLIPHNFHLEEHPLAALGLGVAFALGWTPCLGPVLAGILTLAATEASISSGIILLFSYSMGLAIPFIVAAIALPKFLETTKGIRRHLDIFMKVSGFILALMGILLVSGGWTFISYWLLEVAPWLGKLG